MFQLLTRKWDAECPMGAVDLKQYIIQYCGILKWSESTTHIWFLPVVWPDNHGAYSLPQERKTESDFVCFGHDRSSWTAYITGFSDQSIGVLMSPNLFRWNWTVKGHFRRKIELLDGEEGIFFQRRRRKEPLGSERGITISHPRFQCEENTIYIWMWNTNKKLYILARDVNWCWL